MKARIIIEYEGDFTDQDLQDEVRNVEEELDQITDNEFSEPKFDTFKVSSEVIK